MTVAFECDVCWARAATPEQIEHQPVIRHPPDPMIRRFEFPIILPPSAGAFGQHGVA